MGYEGKNTTFELKVIKQSIDYRQVDQELDFGFNIRSENSDPETIAEHKKTISEVNSSMLLTLTLK